MYIAPLQQFQDSCTNLNNVKVNTISHSVQSNQKGDGGWTALGDTIRRGHTNIKKNNKFGGISFISEILIFGE